MSQAATWLDDPGKLATVNLTDIHSRHFVQRKDLIFRSRGLTTTAILTDLKQDRVIVAAPLMRLRVTNQNVLPEYLCWYINQPSSQTFLHSRATGSLTVMVGKSILGDLTVPIPSLAEQRNGLTLVALSSQEQHLLADIAIRRKRLVGNTLMQLITRDEG